jgi:hypothetical protein
MESPQSVLDAQRREECAKESATQKKETEAEIWEQETACKDVRLAYLPSSSLSSSNWLDRK